MPHYQKIYCGRFYGTLLHQNCTFTSQAPPPKSSISANPNVVGYQSLDVKQGVAWVVQTLQKVGSDLEDQTLESFKMPVSMSQNSAQDVKLEMYDENGDSIGYYYYLDTDEADMELSDPTAYGWYDGPKVDNYTYESADSAVVPYGIGAVIYNDAAAGDVTFSGQVVDQDYPVDCLHGVCWSGNVCPATKTLGDFVLPVSMSQNSAQDVKLELYDENGDSTAYFYYLDTDEADMELSDPDAYGWYDGPKVDNYTYESATSQSIPSGAMFVIYNGADDGTLTLPHVSTK